MQVTACTGFSIATSTEGTPKAATKIDFFCGVNNRHAGRLVGTAQAHQIPDSKPFSLVPRTMTLTSPTDGLAL